MRFREGILIILFTLAAILVLDRRYRTMIDQITGFNMWVLDTYCTPNERK